MSARAPILMLGGYGSVGTRTVRMLRRLHRDLPVVIAGRDLSRAQAFAEEIGHATATTIDLAHADLGQSHDVNYSLVVTALRDLSLNSMRFAQMRGIPYVALSDGVFEIGPTVTRFAHHPAAAPILLLGHGMGAVPMLAALHCTGGFRSIEAIEVGLVFDPDDPLGPASAMDMARIGQIGPAPLILDNGRWRWIGPDAALRRFIGIDGTDHEGQAVGLVDVLSLSVSGAHTIRVDLAEAATASSRRGEPPSHEVVIEITGEHVERGQGRFRCGIVDPEGYAALSARGIAIVVEALLGLGGQPAPGPGLYFPETVVDPTDFVQRLQHLGIALQPM